jgi:hypothetical protein
MSRGNWILLILGIAISVGVYRNKSSDSKMRIKIWGDLQGSLIDPNKRPEYLGAKRQLEAYKFTLVIAILIIVISLTNWQFNFISGPVLFVLSGSALIFSYYLRASIPAEVQLKLGVEKDARIRLERDLWEIKKGSIIALAVIIAVSGNWEYRIQKDSSEQMQYATNEALGLVGTGWCSNFWDINTEYYPEVEPTKTGGWPCINVGAVTDVKFSRVKNHLEMCFSYSLNRSDGLPSQESTYEYDYKKLCSTDSWYVNDGGWSTDSLGSKIYKVIKPDLDKLQESACRSSYYFLTEEERIVYC